MASPSIRFNYEPMRSLDFASIGAAYMGIGTAVSHPVRMYELYNLTNTPLVFSIDGVDDHFPMGPNSYKILDIVSNKGNDEGWFIGQTTRFYVKQLTATAPTSGSVYLTIAYGS